MSTSPTPAAAVTEPQAQPERPRIIAAAQALYLQQGILAVSMADIASHLGLPESTVLKWFHSKEPLVHAVVDNQASHMHEELRRHNESSSTAVEELLALRLWVAHEIRFNSSLFFRELEAEYPDGWQCWREHMAGFMLEHIRNNLRWGMLQDLYRENLNVDFLARLWQQQMALLSTAEAAGLDPAEVHHTLLAHFLAGIVTPAGAFVVRRLQEAPPYY